MNTQTIARQMLTLANLPATNGAELQQFALTAVQQHEVGGNSALGLAYAAMRSAPLEMTRKVICDACYAAIVEGATLSLDDITREIMAIEQTANQIIMVLASARGFSPHPVKVFSRYETNGITGDRGTWINLTAPETLEYLASDEFEPNRYAAEAAMKRIDWASVGFDDLQDGEPIYSYFDGELVKDTAFTEQVAKRAVDFLQRFNTPRLDDLLSGAERWQHMNAMAWVALNERFIKEAIAMYVFWQPILQQRVERAQDDSYIDTEIDGRHHIINEGEDQRMQEGKSLHLLTDKAVQQHNLDQLDAMLRTVIEMVERNVGKVPTALGRPLAAKTVRDEVSGEFLYMDIDTALKTAIREREQMEAEGRVHLTEEKRTRRATAVTSINLDF